MHVALRTTRRALITLGYGVSQIFLTRSLPTAILMVAAIAWYDRAMVALVLLGALVTSLVGWAFAGRLSADLRDGLHGYNGALIGAASYVSYGAMEPAIASCLVGSLAGAALTQLLTRFFTQGPLKKWKLPVLTAPFCLSSGILTILGANYVPVTPLQDGPSNGSLVDSLETIANSVSQVVLADSPISGALVVLALFFAGWRYGVAALGGAVFAWLFVTVTGQDVITMRHGLLGFSGVLVAIALGVLFVRGSVVKRLVVAGIGILIAEILAVLMRDAYVPVYTWPFIISTWLMLVIVHLLEKKGLIADPDAIGASADQPTAEVAEQSAAGH